VLSRLIVSTLAVGAFTVGPVGAGIALRQDDPPAALWRAQLSQDEAQYPAIAPAADAQVSGLPLYLQLVFVSGAIGGRADQTACLLARSDPHAFRAAARRVLLRTPADWAYIHSQGLTGRDIVTLYRNGVLFGCNA
jgi:hypothetical protein